MKKITGITLVAAMITLTFASCTETSTTKTTTQTTSASMGPAATNTPSPVRSSDQGTTGMTGGYRGMNP